MSSSNWETIQVDIFLVWMRDGGAFSGYMQTEEFRSWTPVADATEYIDLPTEGILRRLILRAEPGVLLASGSYDKFYNIMNTIKYTMKSGQTILYDGDSRDLAWLNAWEVPAKPLTGYNVYQMSTTQYKRLAMGYVFARPSSIISVGTTVPGTVPGEYGGGDDTSLASTVTYSEFNAMLTEFGIAPWAHMFFLHDKGGELAEGIDLRNNATVQLELKCKSGATVTGSNSKVIIERFMR